ncbi:MAG: GAF domain-containing protein [Cyclobacteriaceae bacterium]|nr:GAF domain-containing protein [Cyclobacteriaceae bacterium]UYN86793.1 MAG: GAF domain-containing protein [Cyclobacteriaceae bacterium]
METKKLTAADRKEIFESIKKKSDGTMTIALAAYFIFGIFLSFFYDTYLVAFGVGGLSLAAYFITKAVLPNSNLYQYVLGGVLAVFAAQFIYQMHGLFEMHFFVFVGSTLLITYQNWRLQLPLIILVVVHHASFAYLQYLGNKEIYFTQLDYMDLQTFMFHGALAAVIVAICGYWAYDLEKKTISEYANKTALEGQLKNVTNNIAFAEQISSGNLTVEYNLTDSGDELGKALVKMRENLLAANTKEQQEKFITIGITQVGDVIRNNADSLQNLADDFIRTVVKYMGMNQGGLFLVESEGSEQYLNLTACYAYERKKYLSKRVEVGQGLVGQCFLEKDIIYMTKVPQNYVQITSGLGEATPGCIVIVPVMTSDEIVGVMELASFKPLEKYQIDFLKKVAENIASSIVSSRVTERVKKLLAESQQQTEEMRAQEEEMRQNMEELQATQEEMRRKEVHVRKVLEEEQAKAERTRESRNVLLKLTKDEDVQLGNWDTALEKITSSISKFLGVTRTSIWTYHEDRHSIISEKLYVKAGNKFESGVELFGKDFPRYFKAVLAEENIVAENAHTHPATSEFSEIYLKPLNIESMLDVPIFNQGKILGVICCEHQHEQKKWTDEDADFLRSCADLITVVFKSKQLNSLSKSLSVN